MHSMPSLLSYLAVQLYAIRDCNIAKTVNVVLA